MVPMCGAGQSASRGLQATKKKTASSNRGTVLITGGLARALRLHHFQPGWCAPPIEDARSALEICFASLRTLRSFRSGTRRARAVHLGGAPVRCACAVHLCSAPLRCQFGSSVTMRNHRERGAPHWRQVTSTRRRPADGAACSRMRYGPSHWRTASPRRGARSRRWSGPRSGARRCRRRTG